ncbi:MAG: hypothetical protein AAFR04_01065 [Pseudomonadota bacterium]
MRRVFFSFAVACLIAASAIATLVAAPKAAEAGTITFYIKSSYPYSVDLAFYSQSRSHEWPGSGRVWILRDSKMRAYKLACRRGERICYGAWVRGRIERYWGVGHGNNQRCAKCCWVCNNNASQYITLRR